MLSLYYSLKGVTAYNWSSECLKLSSSWPQDRSPEHEGKTAANTRCRINPECNMLNLWGIKRENMMNSVQHIIIKFTATSIGSQVMQNEWSRARYQKKPCSKPCSASNFMTVISTNQWLPQKHTAIAQSIIRFWDEQIIACLLLWLMSRASKLQNFESVSP